MDKIKCGHDSGGFYSIGPWRKPSEMEALKTLKADNMMAEIFRTASKPRSDRSQLVLGEKLSFKFLQVTYDLLSIILRLILDVLGSFSPCPS